MFSDHISLHTWMHHILRAESNAGGRGVLPQDPPFEGPPDFINRGKHCTEAPTCCRPTTTVYVKLGLCYVEMNNFLLIIWPWELLYSENL